MQDTRGHRECVCVSVALEEWTKLGTHHPSSVLCHGDTQRGALGDPEFVHGFASLHLVVAAREKQAGVWGLVRA